MDLKLNVPFTPMTLKKSDIIPKDKNYIHQFKWDGHRGIIHYNQGLVRLFTREKNLITNYPEISSIQLPVKNCILDGECIVLDNKKNPPLPCFESIMTRFHTKKDISVKRLLNSLPIHYVVWDIIYLNDKLLNKTPLHERIKILESIIKPSSKISITPSYNDGDLLYNNIVSIGAEGVVSKHRDSIYVSGSASNKNVWYKIKNYQYTTAVIIGYRKKEFGWGLSVDGKFAGVLEFSPMRKYLQEFYQNSKGLITKENREWVYLEPEIKCRIKFQCFTKDGKLRSPYFIEFIK